MNHNTMHPSFRATASGIITALLIFATMAFGQTVRAADTTNTTTPAVHADTGANADASTIGPGAYAALLAVLENAETREQLLSELRKLSEDGNTVTPPDSQVTLSPQVAERVTAAPPKSSLTTRLQHFAAKIQQNLTGSWTVLSRLARGAHVPGVAVSAWQPALNSMLVTIIAVIIAYLTLRVVASYGFKRLDSWIIREHAPADPHRRRLRNLAANTQGRKLVSVLVALGTDIAAVLLAGLAGYATVIAFTDKGTAVSLFAMQFLTAFVAVEIVKALSRAVFSTRYERLRLLPINAETAQYWHRWLATLITLTGYSLLLIVPVTETILTPSVGNLIGLLLMLAVYLYAVSIVWGKRHAVRDGLTHHAERSTAPVSSMLTLILARLWHWLAIIYFTVLFVVSQIDQQDALSFMARATVQSILAILAGAVIIMGITSLSARRVHLPERWRHSLPSLEFRINTYIPAMLRGLRLLTTIAITLVVLDAWRAFNLAAWVTSQAGRNAISMIIHVGIILLVAATSWTILASIIEHRLGTSNSRRPPSEREKTLLMLFRNASAITIVTLTVLVVLSQIGIDIGPLIAGAGVVGLAIGFGAQKLVQDVITGVFIQLENGMNQNDIVEVAGLFGTVEKVTIRSVVIRTLDGGYHLIPFSAIDKVSNHTRDYGYHYAEYNVAHRESVDDAIAQLHTAFTALMNDPNIAPEVLEDISIPGVTSLNERGFTIRVMIKTTPGNQWAVQRAFNRLVKQHFDAAGIELPYPQTVVHFGRDKHGNAAPVDLRQVEKLGDAFDVSSAPGQTTRAAPAIPDAPQVTDPGTA